MTLKRSRLKSGKPIARKTAMKKRNPERQAKKKVRQASKHRAYMRSETRKAVDERAGGRCEAWLIIHGDMLIEVRDHMPERIGISQAFGMQCVTTGGLQHHHLTYARYGGDELPEDMLKVCRRCHQWLESQHPTRKVS